MLPSAIVIPPPVPAITVGSLVGPLVPLALGLATAVLLAALVGVMLGRLRSLSGAHDHLALRARRA